jgi:hypothetical protein
MWCGHPSHGRAFSRLLLTVQEETVASIHADSLSPLPELQLRIHRRIEIRGFCVCLPQPFQVVFARLGILVTLSKLDTEHPQPRFLIVCDELGALKIPQRPPKIQDSLELALRPASPRGFL